MKIKEVSEKLILQNRRGQNIFFLSPNSEGSQSGGVLFSRSRRGPNPEGSYIYQLRGVSNRRGVNFPDPEGSYFCQSGGVLFCQPGGVLFCLRT